MFTTILLFFIPLLILIFILSLIISKPRTFELKNSHVFITGGSSGIGKALAKEAVRRGACVTIVARNQKKLEDAREDILSCSTNIQKEKKLEDARGEILSCSTNIQKEKVQIFSVDITKDATSVQMTVQRAESILGPVQMLINCAGSAVSKTFEDTSPEDFKRMIELNYLGSVYTTKAVIPSMKAQKKGRVVFVSSQAGQVGLFGFTAYCPSKFALKGLAESLQMEVKPYNIYITLAHPADTDTPGYAEENTTKPKETMLISETAGLYTPDSVATTILNHSVAGKFCSYNGMDGFLLASVTSGMSPVTSLVDAVTQIFTSSVFRVVCLLYLAHFDRIVRKCKQEREQTSKKEK